MALENVITSLVLDVIDHDQSSATVKAIALDSKTRYVQATVVQHGLDYDVDPNAVVTLTILRPDNVGVQITGSVVDVDNADRTGTIKGVFAELTQAALAKSGTLRAQFKMTVGEQILRTEIFRINNGIALDGETSEWADQYQGYDLEEVMQTVNEAVSKADAMEEDVSDLKEELNDIFTETPTDNLFNKDTAITGSYVNPYTGEIINYNGVFHAFIELKVGTYTFLAQPGLFGGNAYAVAMFDEDDNFTSYTEGTHTEIDSMNSIVTITFSSQAVGMAKYFSINGTTDILNTLMVVKGTEYPTEYVEYGSYKTIEGLQISKSQIIDLNDETNPLKGKIISLNGDSIASGVGYQGGYGKIIAEENGMTYENIAIGGGTVAYVSANVHCISRTIGNMRADADYIILDGGGNDADSGVPLGTLSTGYDATLDDTTFAGAFENMLKTAIARFPNKKIGYVFIHKCAYLFSSSVRDSYYDIAKSACEKWGIPYCDLNTQTPPLNYISALRTAYTANGDGYHPNEDGYRLFYVPKITAWLKTL